MLPLDIPGFKLAINVNMMGLNLEFEPFIILRVHLVTRAQRSIEPGIDWEPCRLQATVAVPIGTVQRQHLDEWNSFQRFLTEKKRNVQWKPGCDVNPMGPNYSH